MIYVFGDSISNPGYGAQNGKGYAEVARRELGSPVLTNFGISGGMTADQTTNLCSVTIQATDKSIVELGTNDHWIYGSDATKVGYYAAGIQAVMAYLATPQKTLGKNVPSSDMTGTWANTPSFGIGKMGSSIGGTLKFHASGTSVYLGGVQFDGMTGAFQVSIDGVDKGTFSISAPGLTTYHGMPCGQRLYRFAGLPDGAHEVLVTMVSGQYVYMEWCAGNSQSNKPPVYVMPLMHLTAACYASRPPLNDTTLAMYNDALRLVASQLFSDGLNVKMVESESFMHVDFDMYDDGLHPNGVGHTKLGLCLADTMQA